MEEVKLACTAKEWALRLVQCIDQLAPEPD